MFYSQVDSDPDLVDHGELMEDVSQIESGDNSLLYAFNIYPTQEKSKSVLLYKQRLMIKVGWNRIVQTRFAIN